MKTSVPGLTNQHELADVLADAALYAHLSGDDAGALEYLRDVFAQAHAVSQQPAFISRMVSMSIEQLGLLRLQLIAPELHLADDPHPPPSTQPVLPAQRQDVQVMIKFLLQAGREQGMLGGFFSERAMTLDLVQWISSGSLLAPMYRLDGLGIYQNIDQDLRAAGQTTLGQMRSMGSYSPRPNERDDSASNSQVMRHLFGSHLGGTIAYQFRWRTEFNMMAVVLAARLYQIDHAGRWPVNLQSLVPDYLPLVPPDLMTRDARPLGYILLNQGRRPIVYSVGTDGADQTGDGSVVPALPQVGWDYHRQPDDQWRDISRFDPPTPPN